MAKGKYVDLYWSTKKEKEGYTWFIRSSHKKDSEVLQSSKDKDNKEDQYLQSEGAAVSNVIDAIQDYYS